MRRTSRACATIFAPTRPGAEPRFRAGHASARSDPRARPARGSADDGQGGRPLVDDRAHARLDEALPLRMREQVEALLPDATDDEVGDDARIEAGRDHLTHLRG